MHLVEELAQLDGAEGLFARYGVEFDPRVMAVHRLHVLRRFGIVVRRQEAQNPHLNEVQQDRLYQHALAEAQAHFANPANLAEPPIPVAGPVLVSIRRRPSEV